MHNGTPRALSARFGRLIPLFPVLGSPGGSWGGNPGRLRVYHGSALGLCAFPPKKKSVAPLTGQAARGPGVRTGYHPLSGLL